MTNAYYRFAENACGPEPSIGWLLVTVAVFTAAFAFICFALFVIAPPIVRELAAWGRELFADDTTAAAPTPSPAIVPSSSPPVRRPPYNHTRADSPLTPCAECRAIARENLRRS